MPGPFRGGHIESYNRTVETLCRDCDSRPPPDVKTCPVSAGSTGAGWIGQPLGEGGERPAPHCVGKSTWLNRWSSTGAFSLPGSMLQNGFGVWEAPEMFKVKTSLHRTSRLHFSGAPSGFRIPSHLPAFRELPFR